MKHLTDKPEFFRPFAVDRLQDKPTREHLEANEEECAALAARLQLVGIKSLEADLTLRRVQPGDVAQVTGRFTAEVIQNCVVSLEDFTATISEEVKAYYAEKLPTPKIKGMEEDIPLEDEHAPEPIPASGFIDLGELVAQHLSLELDPHPRKPGVTFKPPEDGVGEKRNPFAVLADFKAKKK